MIQLRPDLKNYLVNKMNFGYGCFSGDTNKSAQFSLLNAEHSSRETFRYFFNEVSISFDVSERNGSIDTNLSNNTWIYNINIHAFKNPKLHNKYNIGGGYTLEDANRRIRNLLREEIKEIFGDLL